MSKGKVFCFVAHREMGKTTLQKKLADKINLPKVVSDIQGDWEVEYIDPLDLLDMCIEDENKVYVFEDSTAIIPTGVLTKKFRTAVARCRKRGIILFFSFHALKFLPSDLIHMGIDGLFIGKTKDHADKVRKDFKDFPHIISAWEKMQKKTGENIYKFEYLKKP